MTDELIHSVKINLPNNNLLDVEGRLKELTILRCWLDEATEWQAGMYELKFHWSGLHITAWFKDSRHALLCALRWS